MANTYSQIYLQYIFRVEYKQALIKNEWKKELYNYMIAIIQNKGNKVMAINGVADHVHVFVSQRPDQSASELAREVKRSSSIWLNENKYIKSKFRWQKGFGVFSYAKSQTDRVVNYILNQEEHHKKMTFREEYVGFLKHFGVDYDEQYIFKEPE